jgi:signal transduction histidine kinase
MNVFSKNVPELKNSASEKLNIPALYDRLPLESVDARMIGLMRLLLAVSALVITLIDPISLDRFSEITYLTLIGYCIYSLTIYLLLLRGNSFIPAAATHWIDVGWYVVLVALSEGTNSIFFFFFFFAILNAAFRGGFKTGLQMVFASVLLFTFVGYATAPSGQEFELNRFLLRPVYLLLLGYMISYQAGEEIKFKRRLTLLKEVSKLSNPRFGINQTLIAIIKSLRAFYDAESCLLITADSPSSSNYIWREVSRNSQNEENVKVEQTETATPLINLPNEFAIFYQSKGNFFKQEEECCVFDVSAGKFVDGKTVNCTALADLLDAESFITVPLSERETMSGRLYLTSQKKCFQSSDVEFVNQLMENILPVVENVGLLDKLASTAAVQQSHKISRDIHDSTVQPYIGLKLGLEALEIKYAAGESIEEDVEKLIRLADATISELRGFVQNLKGGGERQSGEVLITAVRQKAVKFQEFYDIEVEVQVKDDFYINDRLAAETFQLISEGLSNIRRHTKAKRAHINLHLTNGKLFLEIENDNVEADEKLEFVPKSIAARAKSLGGITRIETCEGCTKVSVEIPL